MSLDESMTVIRAFADPTRVRLLALLDEEELTVAELQEILGVPQSRASTHLARLKDAGMVLDRVDGAHRYYRRADPRSAKPGPSTSPRAPEVAWGALLPLLSDDPQLARDRDRRAEVLAARRKNGQSWLDRVAGSLDRHYSPGRTWESLTRALLLLCELGDVADLGAGDGAIAELLAPHARSIVGIDLNPRMVAAGRERLARAGRTHVRLLQGDMHHTPLGDESIDFVLLQQSLQYAERPAQVLAEAARLLRPGGRTLVVTLLAHKHEEVRASYGHVHLGFRPAQLQKWLQAAGLDVIHLTSAGRERRPPQFDALAVLAQKPRSSAARKS